MNSRLSTKEFPSFYLAYPLGYFLILVGLLAQLVGDPHLSWPATTGSILVGVLFIRTYVHISNTQPERKDVVLLPAMAFGSIAMGLLTLATQSSGVFWTNMVFQIGFFVWNSSLINYRVYFPTNIKDPKKVWSLIAVLLLVQPALLALILAGYPNYNLVWVLTNFHLIATMMGLVLAEYPYDIAKEWIGNSWAPRIYAVLLILGLILTIHSPLIIVGMILINQLILFIFILGLTEPA